jgi:hypothetical protein
MSQYDVSSLYDFLTQTPEGGLRKMFIDNKTFTEGHFNLLMKVVKGCNAEQFKGHFEAKDFPKVKMGPNDLKLKEKFWADCITIWGARGLLSPAAKAA